MSQIKVNCFMYPSGIFLERYIEKFGRKPKQWTIESLHDLWLKSKKRSDERTEKVWNFIAEIAEKIPANSRNEHLVYYMQDDRVRGYSIGYSSSFKSHSLGHTDVNFQTREEKIDFFLTTELNFEMGEKLRNLKKFESNLDYRVFEVFWSKVQESLREKFEDQRPPKCFALDIAGKKYLITNDDRYGSYYTFKLECEYNEQSI